MNVNKPNVRSFVAAVVCLTAAGFVAQIKTIKKPIAKVNGVDALSTRAPEVGFGACVTGHLVARIWAVWQGVASEKTVDARSF